MFKLVRILVLLSFLPVLAMSCVNPSTPVIKTTPTPTPTPQVDQNNSSSPIQGEFTSTSAKSVTVTDKLGITQTSTNSLKVPLEVITDTVTNSVSTTINHSVSNSITTTIGNNTTVTIPPKKKAYGNYGVEVQITDGRLYDQNGCEGANSYFGPDITYVPFATGWCVWISGQPSCPSVQP